MPVRILAGFVLILACVPVRAQESAPEDPLAALRPEMGLLMTGGPWTEKAVRPIVSALVEKDLHGAASWWIAFAQEAIAAKKLSKGAEAMLKPFAKACEKKGSTPEDRKVVAKLVKAVQAMAASKNFSEARRWLPLIDALVRVAPEPALVTSVAKLVADLGAKAGNSDTTGLVAQVAVIDESKKDLGSLLARRLDALLAEYRKAGCRTGRADLGTAIDGAAEILGKAERVRLLTQLFDAAKKAEPARKLTVLIRGVGTFRALRFGIQVQEMSAESGPPVVLDVFDGEIVQFDVQNFALVAPGDPRKSYANAVGCSLEGLALGWQRNTAPTPGDFAPKLGPVPAVRHSSDPNDPLVQKLRPEWRALGGVVVWEDGSYQVARKDFAGGFAAEFAHYELGRSWVGGNFEQLTLAVVVPTR
jgi:hypothetical protein